MREKLIELLWKAHELVNGELPKIEMVADHLIANGVTFATDNNVGDKMTPTEQKWIPVSERLPNKNDDVLCSRGNHIGALMDVYTYKGDDQWEDSYGYFSTAEYEGITHWMPLPEAPKGE